MLDGCTAEYDDAAMSGDPHDGESIHSGFTKPCLHCMAYRVQDKITGEIVERLPLTFGLGAISGLTRSHLRGPTEDTYLWSRFEDQIKGSFRSAPELSKASASDDLPHACFACLRSEG